MHVASGTVIAIALHPLPTAGGLQQSTRSGIDSNLASSGHESFMMAMKGAVDGDGRKMVMAGW